MSYPAQRRREMNLEYDNQRDTLRLLREEPGVTTCQLVWKYTITKALHHTLPIFSSYPISTVITIGITIRKDESHMDITEVNNI